MSEETGQSGGGSDGGANPAQGWDRGFDGHRRWQVTLGLRLTPAERLQWLEETMEEMRLLQGRARDE